MFKMKSNCKIVYPDVWTIEYSEEQKCFHVETLEEYLKRELEHFINSNLHPTQYKIIALTSDRECAHEIADELRKERGITPLLFMDEDGRVYSREELKTENKDE